MLSELTRRFFLSWNRGATRKVVLGIVLALVLAVPAWGGSVSACSVESSDPGAPVSCGQAHRQEGQARLARAQALALAEQASAVAVIPQTVADAPATIQSQVKTEVAPQQGGVKLASLPVAQASPLETFAAGVRGGPAGLPAGLFVNDQMAFPVASQPAGDPGFVSLKAGTVTLFSMASTYGSTGLLAHNHLAGAQFFQIPLGQVLTLVFGDGSTRRYQVSRTLSVQALAPDSPYSDFVDLASGETLSATDLFMRTFGQAGSLVLQTCIARDGSASWGRYFVIAQPAG